MRQIKSQLLSYYHYLLPKTAHRRHIRRSKNIETELDLLDLIIDRRRESVDVGANIGLYAERLSALSTHVHAFEAHPRLARILKASLPKNVTVYNQAVSINEGGVVVLNVPLRDGFEEDGLSSLEAVPNSEKCRQFKVRTATLDRFSTRDIGFVKIDVEGHELEVIEGGRRLVRERRPIFLIEAEERHRKNGPQKVFEFFRQQEYEGIFIYGRDVLHVNEFRPEMQDASKLRNDVLRRSILYPNNFLFFPNESWKPEISDILQGRLRG